MLVPMMARDRVIGGIVFVASDGRRFDNDDLTLAEDLAFRAALAIDNARLYQEAQTANQTKTDFLAMLSHDLRTPLNAIIGYTDLLQMGIPEPMPEADHVNLQRVRTSATHLLYLIEELLAYARLDGHREEVRLQDVDAQDIARETFTITEPLVRERKLAFQLDLPDAPVPLRTDPDKLRQVLLNLVSNAVKFTHYGSIRVAVQANGADEVRFIVQDTGVGIAPEHQARVFEPFWQVDPSQRSRAHGIGLGLSVVRRLVELLGGTITLQSVLGDGSTFTVILPAGSPDATRMPAANGDPGIHMVRG
jgi:signal transduction histidine kinase